MDATTYVQNMYVVRGGINGGTKAIIVFDESVQEAKESRTLKARGRKMYFLAWIWAISSKQRKEFM